MRDSKTKKVTMVLPEDLIKKAQECTGDNLTATVRRGLEVIAARTAYKALRKMRGKYKFSLDLNKLRKDRNE
jgi:hypothetical protein